MCKRDAATDRSAQSAGLACVFTTARRGRHCECADKSTLARAAAAVRHEKRRHVLLIPALNFGCTRRSERDALRCQQEEGGGASVLLGRVQKTSNACIISVLANVDSFLAQ